MMFGFFCSKLLSASNYRSITLLNSNSRLSILPFQQLLFTIRCFSSLKPEHDKQSFTISYLINNCGLSPNDARSATEHVLFDNTEKPDSVLRLLRDLELTDHTLISQVIRKHPRILMCNVSTTILPKLQFLRSIGFSTNDLQKLICQNPHFLRTSLKRSCIPFYDILKKSLLLSGEQIVTTLKRLASRTMLNLHNMNINLSALRGIGMPQSVISSFVCRKPILISMDVDKFNGAVKEVVEMGFNPMQCTFAVAVVAKLQMSTSTWKCKIDAYAKWGLSEDEIFAAFRKFPACMLYSAKSIRDKMDFLVNKIGVQPDVVLKSPIILGYSLEKRVVPRCSVIGILYLKGFINRKIKLSSILICTDDCFLASYVIKHKEEVPELLDVFQGKKDMEELGLGFDEIYAAALA